jgi:hypothetical protein
MSGPAAGWYDDPSSARHSRWWDGERWTDHTRLVTAQPLFAGGTPTSPTGPPPPSPTPVVPATGAAAWSNRPTGSAELPNEPRDRGNALAIASLVSGMLWLFWLGSIAAIVTGIMALRRKVTGGHQAMAVIGIVLGGLSFLGAPVLAAVAVPVFLDQRDAATEAMTASAVRNAAIEMEIAYTTAGRYPTGSFILIEDVIPAFNSDPAVQVMIVSSDTTGFCLEASHESGATAWYDSRAGGTVDAPCN